MSVPRGVGARAGGAVDAVGLPRVSLAMALARDGGRHAAACPAPSCVRWKRPGERVTEVDLAIQTRMIREIGAWFPEDGVVAEEAAHALRTDREFVWVLDPLDGTNNYAVGIPCFAVSVGILRDGAPWAGVVHDPNTGFTCWAVRGGGAFADDRVLAVERRPLTAVSNVCVRAPVAPAFRSVVEGWLERHKVRGFGSVALHLAYCAVGALTIVLDDRAALWDIAAGAAILLEAGGRLTTPLGEPRFPVDLARYRGEPLPFLAGNPLAHETAVAACRRCARGEEVSRWRAG